MGICESKQVNPNINKEKTKVELNKRYQTSSIETNQSNTKPELNTGHKLISINIVLQVMKSICKIIIKNKNGINYGTGFFMKISESEKYLITNNHVISQDKINEEDFIIEIYNQKKMKLNFNNRKIKYFIKPKDITIIEIKNNDEIYNDIIFLEYDYNYKKGYMRYKNVNIFSIEHPLGKDAKIAGGRIININGFEFDHNIPTDNGSSGCPIILYTENINLIQVIGIHKEANYLKNLNSGTFIGEIFNNENFNEINNNYIIAEIYIKDNEINEEIRIINSYEEQRRNWKNKIELELRNEKEIKNCEIRINNKLIPFNYYHKFPNKGTYIIKYSFNNYLTKTNYMFSNCSSLTNINLSNFNTQNVTDMSSMFLFCRDLTNINLSNFNTQKVSHMDWMFSNCS